MPFAVQIAGQVRDLVHARTLTPAARGCRASRALAAELGVARGVVEQAFDQLARRGLGGRPVAGPGTFVADVGLRPDRARSERGGRCPAARTPGERLVSFDTGTPWVDPRHQAGWRRAWREMSARARRPRGYPEPAGLPELRDRLSRASSPGTAASRARPPSADHQRDDPRPVPASRSTSAAAPAERGRSRSRTPATGPPLRRRRPAGLRRRRRPGRRGRPRRRRSARRPPRRHRGRLRDACASAPARDRRCRRHVGSRCSPRPTARRLVVVEDDYDSEFRYDVAPLPALAQLVVRRSSTSARRRRRSPGAAHRLAGLARPSGSRSWPTGGRRATTIRRGRCSVRFWRCSRRATSTASVRSARRVYAERSELVRDRLGPSTSVTGAGSPGCTSPSRCRRAMAGAVVAAAARRGSSCPARGLLPLVDRSTGSCSASGECDAELDERWRRAWCSTWNRGCGPGLSEPRNVSQWRRGILT